jgi:diacylglycerol kinase family enzyme
MPTIAYRAFARRARVSAHKQVVPLPELPQLTVRSANGQPLPLQVDGDYIGDVEQASYGVLPAELSVVS